MTVATPEPLPPCEVCGSTEHTTSEHESAVPAGQEDGAADYATEIVRVDDDDD